jgi:hypothetical protein
MVYMLPHPEKGILLVGTDGHVMCIIHDVDGQTNGSYINPLPEKIIKACAKKKTKRAPMFSYPQVLRLVDRAAYVLASKDIEPTEISALHLEIAHAPEVEGKFPDWRRVVPVGTSPADRIHLNANLLFKLQKSILSKGMAPISIHIKDAKSAFIVRPSEVPEMFLIVMPMRTGDENCPAIPDWLSKHLPAFEELKAA